MSSGFYGDAFPDIGSETIDSLVNFDRTRQSLYESIAEDALAKDIPENTKEVLRTLGDQTTEAFAEVVRAVYQGDRDDDVDTKVADLKQLWFMDELERAKLLRGLTGCRRHFRFTTQREFKRLFKDMIQDGGTTDDMVAEAKAIYGEGMDIDVEEFFSHAAVKCKQAIEYDRLLKNAGGQALNVSKVALGVGIGMLISRRLQKR